MSKATALNKNEMAAHAQHDLMRCWASTLRSVPARSALIIFISSLENGAKSSCRSAVTLQPVCHSTYDNFKISPIASQNFLCFVMVIRLEFPVM